MGGYGKNVLETLPHADPGFLDREDTLLLARLMFRAGRVLSTMVVLECSRPQQHQSSGLIPTIFNESFHRRPSFF